VSVSKEIDTIDFEIRTNKEFNKSYEAALLSSDQRIKPIIQARRKPLEEKMNCNHLDQLFNYDENKLNCFTFRSRYKNNQLNGRNTSTFSVSGSLSLTKPRTNRVQLRKNLNLT